MPYDYEREVRTANSEAFLILDGENAVGRIDTHFLPGIAHIAIAIDQSLTSDQIEEIIAYIDADMLNTVGSERESHTVSGHSGCSAMTARAMREFAPGVPETVTVTIRVFSDDGEGDYSGNGNGHGHGPLPPPAGSGD